MLPDEVYLSDSSANILLVQLQEGSAWEDQQQQRVEVKYRRNYVRHDSCDHSC
jgi:hypothetical protein